MAVITVKQPFVFTIFGASGDLAKLMLFPALYSLYEQGRFNEDFYIVGFARTPKTTAQFRDDFVESVASAWGKAVNKTVLAALVKRVHYFAGQYSDAAAFTAYRAWLNKLTPLGRATHLAYLAVPATAYTSIIENLAATRAGAAEDIRLVLEKPLGDNQQTAEEIFHAALQHFKEDQFYLLDHYLGKPAVRSIMHLRESNRILSHMMRGYEIANVQITAFEEFGVKERASYFDAVGTIKDFVQSHLMQILALVTMSLPIDPSAKSFQREKQVVLAAVESPRMASDVVVGQYASYTKESGVPKNSRAETFVALRLFIDRLDWHNVPIYVRTGKKLGAKQTYVVVELKKFPFQAATEAPNRLIFELHPFEQLHITLLNKQEDPPVRQEITASHSVACDIKAKCLPPGHAPLILDALRGEKKYFLSFPEVISAWNVVDAIKHLVAGKKVTLAKYADGSLGPKSQHRLPEQDGFSWYRLPS